MTVPQRMAMFPLGTALLPGGLMPLHVFEPRYRDMVRDCLRADDEPEFGQVLITHGPETGGGDERAMVGTVARMLHIDALDADRYAFLAVGVRRIAVSEWLPDDPYPVAQVTDWPDIEPPTGALDDRLAALDDRVRRVIELATQVAAVQHPAGAPPDHDIASVDFEVSADPVLASYQLSSVAPIGPADRYRLLAAPGPAERVVLLDAILDDVEAMLRFRLS